MRITIQPSNFEISELYLKHIEDRVQYIFRNLKQDVKSVNVHINNAGEKMGSDITRCQIRVETNGLPIVYAEKKSDDMYIAIMGGALRARKHLARKLHKVTALMNKIKTLKKKKIGAKTLRLKRPKNQALENFA